MKISEISIKRPVFATMMVGALLVLGLFSYLAIPVDLMPEVDFPFVVVQTVYPGASAESVENDVTKEIEEVINQISGVRHITSRSQEGYSLVFVEFELNVDGAVASQDVREKVATIRNTLPEDIDEPIVSQYDPQAEPIMSLSVSGKRPPREITQTVKDLIKPRLETVTGVGSVEMVGESEREIQILLNIDRMDALELSVDDIRNSVMAANMEIPGGRVDEGSKEYIVRMQGRIDRVADFNNIIVKNIKGTPIYLSEVAIVKDTIKEQRSLARYNGDPSIGLQVIKQSGANVVKIAQQTRAALVELDKVLPPDMKIDIVQDNSTWIEDSIHEILFNIQIGTLLAVLVIFLFLLDWRPTLITGLSIPISLVATFTIMNALGFTLNTMTLMGLSLAVGILVDDAIVVVENIYRHLDQGKSPKKAAYDGTKEIGLAVMATTFSIMVVFIPVAFMEGLIGRFFYQFGMTVAFAILISLFVAFSLTPMMSSRLFKRIRGHLKDKAEQVKNTSSLDKIWLPVKKLLNYWNIAFDAFKPVYERLLAYSLRHRWLILLIATVAFASAIFVASKLGMEFIPEADQGRYAVDIVTPPGTPLDETSERIAVAEKIIRSNISHEVNNLYVTIGSGNNTVTEGRILVKLIDASERDLSAKELMDSTRVLLRDIPGIKYAVGTGESSGGSQKPVEISIRGDDLNELTRLVHKVESLARQVPGVIDIDNTLQEGKPEIQVDVDRDLADDLGINLATLHQTVRLLVEGDDISRYKEGDEEYDVRLQLQERFRSSEQALDRLMIASNKDVPGQETFLVPLGRIAKLVKTTSIGEYLRFDREREARVNANVKTGYFAGTATNQLMELVNQDMKLPPGYFAGPVGTQEIMVESFQNIFKALILAVIFIYFLLASQYESFFDPFSIMFSLPLSLIGAILGLLLFNSSLSIMSMIGIVLLMGLVTKNAILLIDFVKQQREKGVPRTEAVLIAGPIRLRPILMTTFATVFGMLPLALGIGPGAEFRAPMARAVIGGMISSTLLTLVVVPVVYTVIDDIAEKFFYRKKGSEEDEPEDFVSEEVVVDQGFDTTK